MDMLAHDLRLALDPVAFARELMPVVVGGVPDPWQVKVLGTRSKRILLNCSRQSGKSTITAVLGLHTALYRPQSLVLLVSPSLRQSKELLVKTNRFFQALPEKPKPDEENKLALTLSNGSRILSLPSSPDTIRGFSAVDLLVEDEAAYCSDDLYHSIRPMLATSNGRLVLMSTPHGQVGHFFEEWRNGGPEWEKVRITAHDCPRIPQEFLDGEYHSKGERWFNQEYMGMFSDREDSVFTLDMIENVVDRRVKPLFYKNQSHSNNSSIDSDVKAFSPSAWRDT